MLAHLASRTPTLALEIAATIAVLVVVLGRTWWRLGATVTDAGVSLGYQSMRWSDVEAFSVEGWTFWVRNETGEVMSVPCLEFGNANRCFELVRRSLEGRRYLPPGRWTSVLRHGPYIAVVVWFAAWIYEGDGEIHVTTGAMVTLAALAVVGSTLSQVAATRLVATKFSKTTKTDRG